MEARAPHADFAHAHAHFLGEVATLVSARNATLVLVADVPRLRASAFDCLWSHSHARCATPQRDAVANREIRAREAQMACASCKKPLG